MKNYGKAQFKKRLKQFSAGGKEIDEVVVSTLKGCEDNFHTFGVDRGYLIPKDVGSRIEYYPTQKLIDTILLEFKNTNNLK